jgi:4-hydroxybenzoate polyprenyltransferase
MSGTLAAPPSRPLTYVTQLGRTTLLGTTFIVVLLGAASARVPVGYRALVSVILASLACHLAVYAYNDVVDLPVDRTEPRRANSPLVRGEVSPRIVTLVATACAMVAVSLAALAGIAAALWMAVALGLLLCYDRFGKRIRLTPITDLVQGLGWASLAAYGAAAIHRPTATTARLAIYLTLLIVVVNGVHGALRDLANDHGSGARTTAMLFGALPAADRGVLVPRRLLTYAVVLHLGMVSTLVSGLSGVRAVAAAVLGALCLGLLVDGLAHADDPPRSWIAGLAYIVLVLTLPGLLVLDNLDGPIAVVMGVLYVLPWLSVGRPLRQRWAA